MTLKELNILIRDCTECSKGPKELGWGTPEKILFVGQCPTQNSVEKIGGESNFDLFFLDLLARIGITEKDFYFTNAVKIPKRTYDLSIEEQDHFLGHLLDEIVLIKPKLIIALGNSAKVSLQRGRQKFIHIMHPASLKYKGSIYRKLLISELKKIQTKYERIRKKIS